MQHALSALRAQVPSRASSILAVVLASVLLAISARIELPFWPVPMTLETLAVLGLAGLLGMRLAGCAVLLWLAHLIGGSQAVEAGLLPFIPADLAKAALAAALIAAANRLRPAGG